MSATSNLYNYFLTLFISFLIPIVGFSNHISGIISDKNGEPLPFASIYIKNTTYGVSSNAFGEYFIELESGNYTIIFSYIGFENEEPVIYRLGALPLEEIEAVVGRISIKNKKEEKPEAPGMLARHYAPKTSTFLVDDVAAEIKKNTGNKIILIDRFSDSTIAYQHYGMGINLKFIENINKHLLKDGNVFFGCICN